MNRVAMGVLCVVACMFSLARARHRRGALGALALEQMEAVFDVIENIRAKRKFFSHARRNVYKRRRRFHDRRTLGQIRERL
jgi:hypothetical protein